MAATSGSSRPVRYDADMVGASGDPTIIDRASHLPQPITNADITVLVEEPDQTEVQYPDSEHAKFHQIVHMPAGYPTRDI